MTDPGRPFCAEISRDGGEPAGATASRVDNWLLVEYRGLWAHDALAGSGLSDRVKDALRAQRAAVPRAKLLFVRRRARERTGRITLFRGCSVERGEELHRAEVDSYDELVDLSWHPAGKPWRRVDHPLFLVCTHGKHDRCCARYGRSVHDALAEQAEPGWVWQSTHVGGDRFAANVVVLPAGLYFGRVAPEETLTLLEDVAAGKLLLDRFRGRSSRPFHVQAAELHVRRELGLTRLDAVEIDQVEGEGDRWQVAVVAAGVRRLVEVRAEQGELTYLTCSARELRHPRRFAAGTLPSRAA
jgi:hypothetical protein